MNRFGIRIAWRSIGFLLAALLLLVSSFAFAQSQASAAKLSMQDLRALVRKSGGVLVRTFPANNGGDTGVFAEIKKQFWLTFTWYDLTTGQSAPLPVSFGKVQVAQLLGWDDVTFVDMGEDPMGSGWVFPFAVRCVRNDATTPFTCNNEDAYFHVATPVYFGSKPHEELTTVIYTMDGVELAFGPERGGEAMFNADYRSIPPVTTGFDAKGHLFTLTFQNATAAPHLIVPKGSNIYVRNISVRQVGSNLVVGLSIDPQAAKFYTGHIEMFQPLPFLELRFSQQNWSYY